MRDRALAYWGAIAPIPTVVHFGGEAIPVLLEIQDNAAEIAIMGEAGAHAHETQQRYQEQVSRLARAVVQVRDEVVQFSGDPKEDLTQRLAWAGSWPDPFTVALHDVYVAAAQQLAFARAALEACPNPEAQGVSANGDDSGPVATSATGALPRTKPRLSSSTRSTTSTTNGASAQPNDGNW